MKPHLNQEERHTVSTAESVAYSLPLKEWLTPRELEEEFSIKISTQNKMRGEKTIPYSKVGNFIRYSRVEINTMFENAKVV
jgi:hypothetical protein